MGLQRVIHNWLNNNNNNNNSNFPFQQPLQQPEVGACALLPGCNQGAWPDPVLSTTKEALYEGLGRDEGAQETAISSPSAPKCLFLAMPSKDGFTPLGRWPSATWEAQGRNMGEHPEASLPTLAPRTTHRWGAHHQWILAPSRFISIHKSY